MRITVAADNDSKDLAVLNVDDDGLVRMVSGRHSDELDGLIKDASETSMGPPPWLGPYEVIQAWAIANGHLIDPSERPALPELPEGVTP
jgi:hypothetical protein